MPAPPPAHRRAWANDERLCASCGHQRRLHGGNIGKGRFGKSVYCIVQVTELVYQGDWKHPLPLRGLETRVCACREFVAP